MICTASLISRLVLHFTQYASDATFDSSETCAGGWNPGGLAPPSQRHARFPLGAARKLSLGSRSPLSSKRRPRERRGVNDPHWASRAEFEQLRLDRPLSAIFDGLWSAGSLEGLRRPCIAIVGTRAATGYGRAIARRFAADFAAGGCCILSGLALGIDAAAHQGALDAGGVTIGVLGGGHRRFFPKRNRDLAQRMIAKGGAVLSPYRPDEAAYPANFLQRNGIVAALSDALVVIEAPARSGALNTASWAAGRIPVYAVPGDIDRPHVAGCHALIRDGATLARNANDIMKDLQLLTRSTNASDETVAPADPVQAKLIAALRAGERSLDDLCMECQERTGAILTAISILELQGAVEARAGSRYALKELSVGVQR